MDSASQDYTKQRIMRAAYVTSTLVNTASFMQMVSLTYVAKDRGISDDTIGYIQSLAAFMQMVGGPLFSFWIQRYGLKSALLTCYLSCIISGITQHYSPNAFWLALTRLSGLFMQGPQAHQTLMASLTDAGKDRTKAFGRLGLTFGLSLFLSPLISKVSSVLFGDLGSLLGSVSLCVFSTVVLMIVVNEKDLKNKPLEENAQKDKPTKVTSQLDAVRIISKRPNVLRTFCIKSASTVPAMLIFGVLQLHMINKFGATQTGNSMLHLVIGLSIMLTNGFGISWLRNRYSEHTIVKLGLATFLVSYAQCCYFEYRWQIALIMAALGVALTLVGTVTDSIISSNVHADEQAMAMGLIGSMMTLSRTLSPAVAGYLLRNHGFASLGILGLTGTVLGLSLEVGKGEYSENKTDDENIKNK